MELDAQQQKYAIHAACREGQEQKVEALLQSDRKLAALRDDDDRLPLHWAASYNRPKLIEIFSEQKNTFDVDATDGLGWTALMMASSLPRDEGAPLVQTLLAQHAADPNLKNNSGQTALFFAVSKANLDVVRSLLAHGATARVRDKRQQLPLHRAAAIGHVPILKDLLQKQSPVDIADVDGCTPLHHAIAEGYGEAALVLLRAGADSSKKDSGGNLPISLAPDAKVRNYVLKMAEDEGIDVTTA
jgi:26S proteasome non-ATPase regulatory subunit 10